MSVPSSRDLMAGLLPDIEDVRTAIRANGRERKRLFMLQKLILDGEPDPEVSAKPDPSPQQTTGPKLDPANGQDRGQAHSKPSSPSPTTSPYPPSSGKGDPR